MALATVTGCGSSGGSGASHRSASANPAASKEAKRFTSTVYPYSIVLAEGWFSNLGQTAWDGTRELSSNSPAFDYYLDGTHQIFVGAAALSEQPSLKQWRARVIAATPSSCT